MLSRSKGPAFWLSV